MGRDDWFRRATWSLSDQREFHDRLRRSRGDSHKAQYLRIQASHLQQSGLHDDALQLLNIMLADYPQESSQVALALLQMAECLWALHDTASAFETYMKAFAAQRLHPGYRSAIALSFGERYCDFDSGVYRELIMRELAAEYRALAGPVARYGALMIRLLNASGANEEAKQWQRIVDEAQKQHVLDSIPLTSKPHQLRDVAPAPSITTTSRSGKRSKSEVAEGLDAIQLGLLPLLKGCGFKVRGRAFNRTTEDGLTEVLAIQIGKFDPPGTTYIQGLRSNYYGKFTVNLGVFVPEVNKWHQRAPTPSFVRENVCTIRQRLGTLAPEQRDLWWRITRDPSLQDELRQRLERDAFPFFERFKSRDAILKECNRSNFERMGCFLTPPRIVCAIIRYEQGQSGEARALLAEQAKENRNPGHPAYVRLLAERMGLGALDDA